MPYAALLDNVQFKFFNCSTDFYQMWYLLGYRIIVYYVPACKFVAFGSDYKHPARQHNNTFDMWKPSITCKLSLNTRYQWQSNYREISS